MATFQKYPAAIEFLLETINSGTDSWKIALSNTINTADTVFSSGSTDLATGAGYTAGGNSATTFSASAAGGTYKLVLNNPTVWTASGAGFTFRYAILYDATTNTPVGYWDYGASVTVASGETVTVTLDSVNGVFQAT